MAGLALFSLASDPATKLLDTNEIIEAKMLNGNSIRFHSLFDIFCKLG